MSDYIDFECPRCHLPASEFFYGPCTVCVGQMRASVGLDQRHVDVAEYAPKMNVTPNAVASKE